MVSSDRMLDLQANLDGCVKSRPTCTFQQRIGSVDRLPADLSATKKNYLHSTGYRLKHPR